MLTNDEIKASLEQELDAMKHNNQVKRYSVTYKPFTGKFDIWYEYPDGHATTFKDILSIDQLRAQLARCLPVKKSWKCYICRYYLKQSDGCKKGFYNSAFVPCPDWKGPEFFPDDKDFCKALDILIAESQQFQDPIEYIHKGVDWMLTFIIKMRGYSEGLKLFEKLPKGYWIDKDELCECREPIIPWQCTLCTNFIWRENHCKSGLDEGWETNNECRYFVHIPEPISESMFLYLMETIYAEHNDNEASYECIHYNMDKLMSYVVQSLGYVEFAKRFRKLELEYLDVPF